MRAWYDAFEAALANHHFDEAPRRAAARAAAAFHARFQERIDAARVRPGAGLLDGWIARGPGGGLDDEAIRRNALIVIFGGVSTVEALILNTLWSLLQHPDALAAVRADRALVADAINETMRWLATVQSAMRHPVEDIEVGGVAIPTGATVNAMLGAANRDDTVFDAPDAFRLGRSNAARHLGFATGPHHCLGQHLAKAEVAAVVTALFDRLPDLRLAEPTQPFGHEFRQPRALRLAWRIPTPRVPQSASAHASDRAEART